MKIGAYRKDSYRVPPYKEPNGVAGTFTVTVKQINEMSVVVEIDYDNHPEFNRTEEKGIDYLYMWQWNEPLPPLLDEELFTI